MKVLFHESALTDYQSWATEDLRRGVPAMLCRGKFMAGTIALRMV